MGSACIKSVGSGVRASPPATDAQDGKNSKPGEGSNDIRDIYRIGKLLGSGAFGQVRECTNRHNKDSYAVKIMEKKSTEKGHWSNENMFRREVQVLGILEHPYIIKYHGFFEDKHYLYAVMEKCDGGELFEAILRQKMLPERSAINLAFQMLQAIDYLHRLGIVHRDVKAENFLFKTTASDSSVKLIDFGMSARITKGQTLTDVCGSPHYLSPELIRRKYDHKADIWALGVLVYLMLFGRYPFDGKSTNAIVKEILTKRIDWNANGVWPSERAINFIKLLLQRDAAKRPTAAEAAKHAWLASARRQWATQESGITPMARIQMATSDLAAAERFRSENGSPRSATPETPTTATATPGKDLDRSESFRTESPFAVSPR